MVYGQGVVISARASGHRPAELFLTFHPPGAPGEATTVPMFAKSDGTFSQQIERLKTDLVVVAHTKDRHSLSKQRRVSVQLVPRMEKAFVRIAPPAYTGLKAEEKPFAMKPLRALVGSEIRFRLQSNRPLREGRIELAPQEGERSSVAMSLAGEFEVAGEMVAAQSVMLRFSIVDHDGVASQEVWEAPLTVTQDLGPEVRITEPGQDGFVTNDYRLNVAIEGTDDYGIKTLRFHYAVNGKYAEPQNEAVDGAQTHLRRVMQFCLAPNEKYQPGLAALLLVHPKLAPGETLLRVAPGDTLSFFAEVVDTAPNPHLARSQVITLTVISVEDYNDFLRERLDVADIAQKYTALFEKLHELIEQQKALSEAAEKARQQAAQSPDKAAEKKLDELLARQNELNEKLNQVAKAMDEFVREQPVYDLESELGETLKKKAADIRESTKTNDQETSEVAQRSTPKEGLRSVTPEMLADLKKAADDQAERLGGKAEQQEEKKIAETFEDLSLMQEIMKDMNRFKELYEAQRDIAEQMKAYDKPGQLSREDQLALKQFAAEQKAIGEQIEAVEQKLWEDGKAAEQKFPKAAQGAKDLAQGIGDLDLRNLANKGSEAMVQGEGDKGAQLSQRMATEMEKLFAEACQNPQPGMAGELDQYLSLTRGMNPRDSFKQMSQCRKFGGTTGFGRGKSGEGGENSQAMISGTNSPVLGNETAISNNSTMPSQKGISQGKPDGQTGMTALEKSDVAKDVKSENRQSDAVTSESIAERYRALVEQYFKAITK